MEKLFEQIEAMLLPIASRMASNKYLNAVKDGFIFAIPFVMISSFLLLLLNLPFTDKETVFYIEWYANFVKNYRILLMQPYHVGMGIMSIFVAFGIGYSLANSHGLVGIRGGFLSLFAFLIISAKQSTVPLAESVAGRFFVEAESRIQILDARFLGSMGLFAAILSSIVAVEIMRFMINKKMVITLPEAVPEGVAKSFQSLTPVLAVVIIFHGLNLIINNTLSILTPQLIQKIFEPLLHISDSLPAMLLYVILAHLLWFCGIHGGVLGPIATTIALSNLALNQTAFQSGEVITKIWAGDFLNSFVHIGGIGSTLGLAIAMVLSKNEQIKSIGKLSIVPGIFNINEPILFGTPIIMNPMLAIPFITVPILSTVIAYSLAKFNIIAKVVTLVPWTTPAPISVFLATNFNLPALIVNLLLIFMSFLIYTPFLKMYEKSLNNNGNK